MKKNEDETTRESAEDRAHREKMEALDEKQKAELRTKTDERGVLIVNTGDGKGKSSSAFGTAIRAAGHGQRVGIVQFTKGTWKTGEQAAFRRFEEIDHFVMGDGFTWKTKSRQQDMASARKAWEKCISMIEASRGEDPTYRLLVFDELNIVLRYGYLPTDEVVDTLSKKPEQLNIIVTGRDAPEALVKIADTVTDMRAVKHAYQAGVKAQPGIEY